MGVDYLYHHNESEEAFKLSFCWGIVAFCAVLSATPDAAARGDHAGGHNIDSGSYGGHSGHVGGYGHLESGHRHFGDHNHSVITHKNFGVDHRHFDGRHKHPGSGYRSQFGHSNNSNYDSFPRGFSYAYTPGYSYAYFPGYYVPGAYSYSYPFYSTYRPRYFSSSSSFDEDNFSQTYAGSGNAYRYNSASTRYPDIAAGNYSTNDLGWRLLVQSNPRAALDVFAVQAGQHPADGVLKVGYALSAAMQGDLNKAAWSMRRAFSIDPDSLHYLKMDASLRTRIDLLLTEYHNQLNYAQGNRHFDVAFMIAALNYLIHEKDAARVAVEELVAKLGDNSQSAQNLHRLVINNGY